MKTELTRADILAPAAFEAVRAQKRAEVRAAMRPRRVEVGPFATFIFEQFSSIWLQVHEMLRIENGGEAQIDDELAAYNSLIPKGNNLAATLMLEIADAGLRARKLGQLGGIENTVRLSFGDHSVSAVADDDIERTTEEGKTSAVHFLRFPFTPEQVAAFATGGDEADLRFGHPNYRHSTVLGSETRRSLAADFAEREDR